MGDWHPIMAAVEGPTGRWTMRDECGDEYGGIEIRRVGADVRYRSEQRGEILGWDVSLRLACERVHRAYLRAHGPQGGPVASWGRRD